MLRSVTIPAMAKIAVLALVATLGVPLMSHAQDLESKVKEGFADSNGVKIHYATMGSGPLVVMIHGFPDYWYTWRHQMEGLADRFQVVAIDRRGYNKSDKPAGVESYDMRLLVGDVIAVIKHFGKDNAIIVGHDWGGAVAWSLAMNAPQFVSKLVVLNLPHLRGLSRELANNPEQQKSSAYARRFQTEGAEKALTAEGLAGWVNDAAAKPKYIEAFKNSDFTAMMSYYRRNYPREPYKEDTSPLRKVQCPVLAIHGLKDTALLAPALNNNWDYVEKDYTLVTVPDAGHFVQADAAQFVTQTIRGWLLR
jgi:pimeloyl-ACP methyl ester carboxylesterase